MLRHCNGKQVADYEAQVAGMAQALRDGQLQAESAKAALMRALREGGPLAWYEQPLQR